MTPSYTAKLANDPHRHHDRTTVRFSLLNLFNNSQFVDKYVLGPLSVITFLVIVNALCIGSILLIPSIIFSKYVMGWPSILNLPTKSEKTGEHETNVSNTTVGSTMAIKTLFARSQMYMQQSGGPDSIAPLFMRQLSLFGPNIPGSELFTQMYAIMSRWGFYLTGRVFAEQLSEVFLSNLLKFGVEVGLLQPRACWLDDVVESFVKNHEGKPFNVVILGAGYDTRCYRLDGLMNNENVKLYEVDAAGSQGSKISVLKQARVESSHVRFVSVDFETSDWMETLQSTSDFDSSLPSLFVWEGVSYYLDHEVVVETVAKVAMCGKGSCIGFDYWDVSCLNKTMKKSSKDHGEPLKSGIADMEKFLRDCSERASSSIGAAPEMIQTLDHLRCDELKKRYIAQCNGRYIGYLTEFGGMLLLGSK